MPQIAQKSKEMSEAGGVFWPQGVPRPKHSQYTDEEKYAGVRAWLVTGSLRKAEAECGVHYRTLSDWSRSSWWSDMVSFVLEHEEHIIRANFRKTQDLAHRALHERLVKGDPVYNAKLDKITYVPVKAKDLAVISAVAYDKLRLSEGKPSRISDDRSVDDRLKDMVKQFEDIAERAKLKDVVSEG